MNVKYIGIYILREVLAGHDYCLLIDSKLLNRGGIAGLAGSAKAGPLFNGLLVSFPDCSLSRFGNDRLERRMLISLFS